MTRIVESEIEEDLQGSLGPNPELLHLLLGQDDVVVEEKPKARTAEDRLMELAMRKPAPTFREKPIDDRREYMRLKAQEYRDRKAATAEAGKPIPRTPELRAALADAALMLLAINGPGAEQIRNYISKAFPDQVGLPLTVTAKARRGKLKAAPLKSK